MAHVRGAVESVLGKNGDDTIVDYIVSVMEDDDFDFGKDGEEAFESVGPIMVRQCKQAPGSGHGCALLVRVMPPAPC
jgi:hypothetical protein